jgi:hypothetical protein
MPYAGYTYCFPSNLSPTPVPITNAPTPNPNSIEEERKVYEREMHPEVVVRDFFCPTAFLPTFEGMEKPGHGWSGEGIIESTDSGPMFINYNAREGCCVLDKILGIMELVYSIKTCKLYQYKFKEGLETFTMGNSKSGQYTWGDLVNSVDDATKKTTPCFPGLVQLLVEDLHACCCRKLRVDHPDTGDDCKRKAECAAVTDTIVETMKTTLLQQYKRCAKTVDKDQITAKSQLEKLKVCTKAENTGKAAIFSLLKVANTMYNKAPKAAISKQSRKLLDLCKGADNGNQCNDKMEAFMKQQMNHIKTYEDP